MIIRKEPSIIRGQSWISGTVTSYSACLQSTGTRLPQETSLIIGVEVSLMLILLKPVFSNRHYTKINIILSEN